MPKRKNKKMSPELIMQQFEWLYLNGAAIDTETTGLGIESEIWEIAAYEIHSGKELFWSLVNPSLKVYWEITAMKMANAGGITEERLKGAYFWPFVEEEFRKAIGNRILVNWS